MSNMDTGSGDSDVEEMVLPYARRPEWADVSPIHVDDGNCVAAVQYLPEHREALAYFRAVLDSGETSGRVLALTADMIGFNQADYTAWQHRWLCVEALGSDLEVEYMLTESIMQDNAKNYQLWNHRRKVALKAGPSGLDRELQFVQQALDIDDKNYHAWCHRLAVVKAFGLWDKEMEFTAAMIEKDVRNNSAWNHRGTMLGVLLQREPAMLSTVLAEQLTYVRAQTLKAPRNESAWNFLLGLFKMPGCSRYEMAGRREVPELCLEMLALVPSCPPALAALAEYYVVVAEASLRNVQASRAVTAGSSGGAEAVNVGVVALHSAASKAASLFDGLIVADPIRSLYWVHRHHVVQQLVALVPAEGSAMT